jgi:hypothetical protein
LEERTEPVGRSLTVQEPSLCFGEARLCAAPGGIVGRGIDTIQDIACMYLRPFSEWTLLDHSTDLSPHLYCAVRLDLASEFDIVLDRLRCNRDKRHLSGRRRLRRRFFTCGSTENEGGD